ncbi:N-acetyltransferase family protein [Roseibium sp.]|uniref:GNAT family N-acetyltransferase n=1 Tax=Roseibium sp. TaxID=1936156 RepID=UPI003D0AF450
MVRAEGSVTGDAAIRPARAEDLEAVYRICLETGDSGRDASALYRDPKLIGHVFAAPYIVLAGQISFVAVDREGVLGYAVGTADTRAFEERMEAQWWPDLRRTHDEPEGDRSGWTADELLIWSLFHPASVPGQVALDYPAHIHMNLLPRAQGKGVGSRLLEAWFGAAREQGVSAVHAGVSERNPAGLKFWTARGFRPVLVEQGGGSGGTIWCGRHL